MMILANRLFRTLAILVAAAALASCGGSSDRTPSGTPTVADLGGTPTAITPPAVPFSQAKFSFAPVTGAPATVLMRISAQLGKEAFAQHVTLVPSDDPSANYVIKGYLSAVGDVSGTILVYVWDVFDTSGKRVHRISGQETSPSGSQQDPWSGVDDATAINVARRTISALVAWGSAGG